jgi:hypothetical protein
MRTFNLAHLEDHAVHIGLFVDVDNVADLKREQIARNPLFNYTMIDAATVMI